jgi:hypothetical protein
MSMILNEVTHQEMKYQYLRYTISELPLQFADEWAYKTTDKFGNVVIVRYNYAQIRKVMAAKENVRRYC